MDESWTGAGGVAGAPAQALQAPAAADPGPAPEELQLRAWIAAVGRGDEQALGSLYDATLGRVYGIALRITRQPATAEEVAEDVYWQVWRQALRFDAERGNAMTWLLTIARSRALDALRRRDEADSHPEPETLLEAQPGGDADPQNLLEATRRSDALHAALAQLDALPRQLIALAFFRGLTHEEISAQMCLPLGTVKSHIRRAMAGLAQVLNPGTTATEWPS